MKLTQEKIDKAMDWLDYNSINFGELGTYIRLDYAMNCINIHFKPDVDTKDSVEGECTCGSGLPGSVCKEKNEKKCKACLDEQFWKATTSQHTCKPERIEELEPDFDVDDYSKFRYIPLDSEIVQQLFHKTNQLIKAINKINGI